MSNLVERLRHDLGVPRTQAICTEAADEIEALEARVDEIAGAYSAAVIECESLAARAEQAERDAARLREVLREARAGVKNSAVQFGYPYTELVDRIDAELEGKP